MSVTKEVQWQAHRGGGAYEAPDNTMAANRMTWAMGGIPEADLQTTGDGEIICLHDDTLARTTTAPDSVAGVPVSELTFEEIRKWDAGVKFHPKFAGERVPALYEVFGEMQKDRSRRLYMDLKRVDLESLGRLIAEYGVQDQLIFAHNRVENCRTMKRIVPEVKTMLWIGGPPEQIVRTYESLRADQFEGLDQVQLHLNPNPGAGSDNWEYALTSEFLYKSLKETQAAGIDLEVLPFRIEARSLAKLLDIGIRWFATDEPTPFLSCVEMWEKETHSRVLRLVSPGEVIEDEVALAIPEGHVVVEPVLGSVCHADLRYFTGNRPPEVLKRKLPMALIHEGIGRVVNPNRTDVPHGERVVIVPNMPKPLRESIAPDQCCPACAKDPSGNYCYYGRFLGSGVDGLAQSRLVIPAECAIPIPAEVPDEIAVMSELCSVSHQALSRVSDALERSNIAIFGDGPVGYLTAAVMHHVFGVERDRIHIFGAMREKLDQFPYPRRHMVQEFDFEKGKTSFDLVVECTGGRFSESAINQGIDLLRPHGYLLLMGVSEERVPINTRDLLERGITALGSSRSCVADYGPVLEAMRLPAFQETLRSLIPDNSEPIRSAKDFRAAMSEAAAHRDWKKTYLAFQWA